MPGKNQFLVFFVLFSLIFLVENGLAATDGKAIYSKNCISCHGADGKGNEKIATVFKIDPAKLNIVGNETKSKADADLTKIILNGGGKMRGFKDKLSEDEIAAVVKHTRSLQK